MNEDKSFIVLNRKILKWEWYQDSNTKDLFIHLLLMANWEDKKWQGMDIKRGSLITSIKHLSEQTGLTSQNIRTALKKLQKSKNLTIKTTNKYSVITINNYDKYQEYNKQLTNNQQTTNKQLTTTKQYNNITNKQIYSSCCLYAEEIFGRTLNSPEAKLISEWLEHYNEELVREAMRVTVVNGKKYLNYTTGILHNWEDNGYKTLEDVRKNEKEEKEPVEVFDCDWINEE